MIIRRRRGRRSNRRGALGPQHLGTFFETRLARGTCRGRRRSRRRGGRRTRCRPLRRRPRQDSFGMRCSRYSLLRRLLPGPEIRLIRGMRVLNPEGTCLCHCWSGGRCSLRAAIVSRLARAPDAPPAYQPDQHHHHDAADDAASDGPDVQVVHWRRPRSGLRCGGLCLRHGYGENRRRTRRRTGQCRGEAAAIRGGAHFERVGFCDTDSLRPRNHDEQLCPAGERNGRIRE
ncbi:hypothetical protein DFH07DRAFT_797267 [Mycena maculata]|uniref:Uncharacterized protein n=1 Tax=Mycena maculata TaxID=230809 RepID=A0AAD7K3X4_9AGAR|nr:hypothetical protein DFH07DRAFT_797267 [Mycena maculata]